MNDEQIFARAVQLSGDEREDFIARSRGQDPAQPERMQKLLAAHETPDSLLAVDGTSSTTAFVNDDSVGEPIGPYKLLQKLSEGGMRSVYLASTSRPYPRKISGFLGGSGLQNQLSMREGEISRWENPRYRGRVPTCGHANAPERRASSDAAPRREFSAGVTQRNRKYFMFGSHTPRNNIPIGDERTHAGNTFRLNQSPSAPIFRVLGVSAAVYTLRLRKRP